MHYMFSLMIWVGQQKGIQTLCVRMGGPSSPLYNSIKDQNHFESITMRLKPYAVLFKNWQLS